MIINKILDSTIYFSFDRSGFKRHAKSFVTLKKDSYVDKNILITGGTSGIGLSAAIELYHLGANVFVTGRNKEKLEKNLKEFDIGLDDITFMRLDLLDFDSLPKFIDKVKSSIGPVDVFICNAGAMPDDKMIIRTYDSIFASQVVAHYYLVNKMIHTGLLNNGHVSLNSSGGMYPVKIDISDLSWEKSKYDKVASYAIAKRAQVIINEELSKKHPDHLFSCSHPGWVNTPGLKDSLTSFWEFTKDRLRTPEEGADTLVWLAGQTLELDSGKFWFDRKARSTYLFPFTKEDDRSREDLVKLLEKEFLHIDSLN